MTLTFEPGSIYTDSDLFDNFKGVMPGDVRTEEITVKNNCDNCDYIKVYLRADTNTAENIQSIKNPTDDTVVSMADFLSQLSMKVWNGDTLIFDASPDEVAGLASNVYLGEIRKGGTIDLRVELSVPITLSNEYANRVGEVDWIFVVEGFDDPTPSPDDDTMLTVRKTWVDDGVDRPDSVTVHLMKDGEYQSQISLSQDNQWTYTWDKLDSDHIWSVVEVEVPENYEATYTTEGNTTTITNTEKDAPPPPPANPVDLSVRKVWDDNGKDRPESVKVTLYNGDTAIESVWLGDWNNWSYTWRNLDGNGNWQVVEVNIPKGYVPSYTYSNGVVTVTNTASLIQTGQVSWPIPVLSGLGILLIAFGVIMITRKRKNEHA